MSTPVPPCAGRWELFDSVDPTDHVQAAALCHDCPIIAECRTRLELAHSDSLNGEKAGVKYGPQGTWAGMAVGETRIRADKARRKAEERMFTDTELRTLHADYAAGFRSPRTVMAERVYQRNKKREQTARKAAA